jgi:3-hydroxybutyryl-CoA dehydrogenase
MTFKHIGIIGAGQMGSGIAQVAATYTDAQVILVDVSETQRLKAKLSIQASLQKLSEKKAILPEQAESALNRLVFSESLHNLAPCELVLEAIVENFEAKKALFKALETIISPTTLLASNTSSISLTQLAGTTQYPERVVGIHFMNPVPLMKLVEIISATQTHPETLKQATSFAVSLQKTTVLSADYPGFISNRILMPMINEAIFALYEGVGSAEDIDTVMKLGMNHPMGPLQLADFIGLDTCLAILNVLYEGFKDSKYRPCPMLVNFVHAGYLGKKTKRGFYNYP